MPGTGQSLQANSLVKLNYTASGIVFAKANDNNIAIANTQSGLGTLTDVIAPVTLASGKITVTGTAVTGVGTSFQTDFAAGQYLFYYNYAGEPALLGKILSVGSASMTLTENATVNVVGVYCGMAQTILGTSENLMIRIPVLPNVQGVSVILPNWGAYRVIESPLDTGAENNSEYSNLEQYSVIDTPAVPINPTVNIPFSITPVYNFQSYQTLDSNGQKVTLYFQTSANFPSFCYAILNPYGDQVTNLAPNTLYKLFANEAFPLNGIVATTAFSQQYLKLAGY